MTISHTLIGLGGVYGLRVVNNSAKKSLICDESSIPVLQLKKVVAPLPVLKIPKM
jgi:hypothetical protein